MPGESQSPPWGPAAASAAPVQSDVSAVGGGRSYLTAGQKLGFLIVAGVLALGAIFVLHRGGHDHAADAQQENSTAGIGGIGRGFQGPPQNGSPAKHASLSVLPAPPPGSARFLPQMLQVHQETPAEKALNAPVLAYGSGTTVAGPPSQAVDARAVTPAADEQAPSADPLASRLTASHLGAADASLMPHPNLTIPAGTLIPCTLQTAIDSGLPGFVTCVLPQAVRGATGTVTLLDRGTKVLGEIQGGLVRGEDRLFILWTQARTPQGVLIDLASPAAGPVGRAGVAGAVDYHFWKRFGAAMMFTVLGGSLQAGANAVQGGSGNTYFEYFQPATGQVANTALEAQINIPPTLRKNQGDSVSIFVARNLNFSKVYKLETAAP